MVQRVHPFDIGRGAIVQPSILNRHGCVGTSTFLQRSRLGKNVKRRTSMARSGCVVVMEWRNEVIERVGLRKGVVV